MSLFALRRIPIEDWAGNPGKGKRDVCRAGECGDQQGGDAE